MESHFLQISLVAIITMGVFSAWLANRLKLPSILLLILAGLVAGPFMGWIHVDKILGDLIGPVIQLAVAIILFEGGLTLNIADLKKIGKPVRGLLTIGIIITFALTTLSAKYFLDFGWSMSLLIGSILIVTGPTVIAPMLRLIKPSGKSGSILKWEGIVIDPIGVMIAVLVFEIIIIRNPLEVPLVTLITVFKTILFGGGIGFLSAWLLIKIFRFHLVPHYLQNAFTFMVVLLSFAVANEFQEEAGLLTVTIMGIMMASQNDVLIDHIVEFKENLQLLLIPSIFIILSSRIPAEAIDSISWNHGFFLISMIVLVRPISVFFSTLGTKLSWKEKLFLGWMAPRGIVAAAMASIFAIELKKFDFLYYDQLVPTIFLIILGTVAVYGLTSGPLAYLLKIANPNPQGVLILGGSTWVRQFAKILLDHKIDIMIIDTNRENVLQAEKEGLPARQLNILTENSEEDIDLSSIGRLYAMTPNQEVNSIAAIRFAGILAKNKVYQLSSEERRSYRKKELSSDIRGRILFSSGMTYEFIQKKLDEGAKIGYRQVNAEDVKMQDNPERVPQDLVVPLAIITPGGTLRTFAADNAPKYKEGDTLVYLDES